LSTEKKNLGQALNKKLKWRTQLQIVFTGYIGSIEVLLLIWRLKPRVVYLMYTMVMGDGRRGGDPGIWGPAPPPAGRVSKGSEFGYCKKK
jgi:hypothetical protein